MKKSELREMISEIVREEVRAEIREQVSKHIKIHVPILVKESLEELAPASNRRSLAESVVADIEDWRTLNKKPVTTTDLSEIRNRIRAETVESSFNFDNSDDEMAQSILAQASKIQAKTPELQQVKAALTKDYSSLMKKMNIKTT